MKDEQIHANVRQANGYHCFYAPIFGINQVLVPEIVKKVGGFSCVARNVSWVRNGYVEETYIKKN